MVHLHTELETGHCDNKPDNVIIKDDLSLALIDFGHAKSVAARYSNICGTKKYWPPELRVINDDGRGMTDYLPAKIDSFTLGMSLFLI